MKTTTRKPSSKSTQVKSSATKTVEKSSVEKQLSSVKKNLSAPKKNVQAPLAHAVGRRKSSVARVWVRQGKGAFMVNSKEALTYFDTDLSRARASAPWTLLPQVQHAYDVDVTVSGGGIHSQADAVKLGIARALITIREDVRDQLRSEGLLTVDSRIKERKKYGQRGARRKFQFVKR